MEEEKKLTGLKGLKGCIEVASDKSISHRGVMFGSLAKGTTTISNFLLSEDSLATIDCFRKLGVDIKVEGNKVTINSNGIDSFTPPSEILDCKNSGTTARLISGILSTLPFSTTITGDESLKKRPMKRIIDPLESMGAKITHSDYLLPITYSPSSMKNIDYTLPIASAQLKSAVILASLGVNGKSNITEPVKSRNHTETMLKAFSADIAVEGNIITVGKSKLIATDITVPNDISSAAFFMVLGLITKESKITIKNVGLNVTRTGIIDVLKNMGGSIKIDNITECDEPYGDITVETSDLNGTVIEGDIIPRLIDEIPIIAVAASFAKGKTVVKDAYELKVKESNRIKAVTTELNKAGVSITETEDGFIIDGDKSTPTPAVFDTYNDHRMAMAMSVLSSALSGESIIRNSEVVNISYPTFYKTIDELKKESEVL